MIILFVLWFIPCVTAIIVGQSKGRTAAGFLLGFFLGWLGAIAALFLENYIDRERRHNELIAAVNGSLPSVSLPSVSSQIGSTDGVKVRCQKCRGLVLEDAVYCNHCSIPLGASISDSSDDTELRVLELEAEAAAAHAEVM